MPVNITTAFKVPPLNLSIRAIHGPGGSDQVYTSGIARDSSGNTYISGTTAVGATGSNDAILMKFGSDDALVWQRLYGGVDVEFGYAVTVDSAGNIYLVGETQTVGAGSSEAFIAKYDTNGNILWQRSYGGSDRDIAYAVATDSSNVPPIVVCIHALTRCCKGVPGKNYIMSKPMYCNKP